MKTDYYLMVTDWVEENIGKRTSNWDLVHKVPEVNNKQAAEKAKEYERELNNGNQFTMERLVLKKDVRYSVLAIPYSQAREYVSFDTWKCNRE